MSSDPEFFAPEHAQKLDWPKLGAYLHERGMRFSPEPPPRQFIGGFGNLNYLLTVDGTPAVLRRPPMGPLPPGGNDMAREFRVLSAIHGKFPLAPRAFVFCDDIAILGAPFFIMEYRPGLVMRRTVPPELKGKGRELSHMIVDVLAEFHAIDPKEVGLDGFGKPEGFLQRAVDGWIKRCAVASKDVYKDGEPCRPAREVAAWLMQQKVPAGDVTLIHNDFKFDNIILDPKRPTRPIAVLDWDMCTRGDPLFDLGTLVGYWIQPGDPKAMHEMGQIPAAGGDGFLSRREVVDLYARKTGREMSGFQFIRVLTQFKLAVIFLQIYARFCRGNTADPRIGALGPTCDGLFEFAHDVAMGRTF